MSADQRKDHEPEWSEVRALFEECLELPADQRAARLAAADPATAAEAEGLLREIETNPGSLDPELGHRSLVASAERLLAGGRTIGGYRILEVLGHGGMSTVYLAEQEHPKRRVALKLLTAVLSSSESLQRFRNEGELLARLLHPGIAQIHAAGIHEEDTAMGPLRWPYLVMEYVEGSRTLADYVAERRATDREILELFLQICSAVQHAHERGVVHRDLKPQNVLVDESGRAKVIDFGIARSVAESMPEQLTRTGDVIGTLNYMSPEQVRGEAVIDTRSDVHALGTMLFRLLTGALPFDFEGRALPEVARILADVEATPLKKLRPDADVDLELIIATALAKMPDHRYSTAGALAEDVRRYLDSEPINARPPSLRYQLRMFARRRRGFVAATLTVLLVSTIGGVSSFVYAVQAHDARQHAVTEGELKDDALRRTFDMTIRTVTDLPRRLKGLPRATELRRTLIGEAASQLEFVQENLPIDDRMRRQLARAYYELGNTQRGDVADPDAVAESDASYDRCEAFIAEILAESPDDLGALHLKMDLALRRGMEAYNRRRDMDEAEACWAVAKATLDRLEQLPPHPGRDLRRDRANYESCLASVSIMNGDSETEIAHLQRCRELHLERLAEEPDSVEIALALGNVCHRLGHAWARAAEPERELAAHAEATKFLAIGDDHRDHMDLRQLRAKVRNRYGYVLTKNGRTEEGEHHLRWSWKELDWLRQRDPHDAWVASSFALASSLLGEHLVRQAASEDDPEVARELYIEARKIAEVGLEVTDVLLGRSRDMQSLFVSGVCRTLIEKCKDALQ